MINLAGTNDDLADQTCLQELKEANIPVWEEIRKMTSFRNRGEVPTNVMGYVNGWIIERAWRYWIAKWSPPAPVILTMEKAIQLHSTHGSVVRVNGHCMAPSPEEWWPVNGTPCLYHIDTQEGLNAFGAMIQ